MKKLRWWWRCWRARHWEWLAYCRWREGRGSYGEWKRAMVHYGQVYTAGPS